MSCKYYYDGICTSVEIKCDAKDEPYTAYRHCQPIQEHFRAWLSDIKKELEK